MKEQTTKEHLIVFLQDLLISCNTTFADLKSFIKKFKTKPVEPSYLAYNIIWFTNCSWLEQIWAYKQIDTYLDKGKVSYK